VLSHYEHDTQGATAAWRSGQRAGICLLLAPADLQALREAAAGAAVRLDGVHPLWAGAVALALQEQPDLQDQGCVCVVEGCIVTVIELSGGGMVRLQRHWLAHADAGELARLVVEHAPSDGPLIAIGHGVSGEPPASLRVVGSLAQAPGALLARFAEAPLGEVAPDFVRVLPPRLRSLGWAMAGTAACVLALALGSAWDAYGALSAEASPEADASTFDATPTDAVSPKAEAEQKALVAERAAQARLAYPWPQLFVAAEAAAPRGGSWLSLEHRATQSELRLSGLAPNTGEALAVAQRLAGTPGIADAFVSRSEPRDSGLIEFVVSVRPEAARGTP
jgi:hypothetical protein